MKRNPFWTVVVVTLVGNVAVTVTTTRDAKAESPAAGAVETLAAPNTTLAPVRTTSAARIQVLATSSASQQSKDTLRVPGGLAFSEGEGYENWPVIASHHTDAVVEAIVGNPVALEAFRTGIPANGKPFPDGSRLAKVIWKSKASADAPYDVKVPGAASALEFMVKDAKRFPDSGGWGYAVFWHDAATGSYRPGTQTDNPPQRNDAKCGAACHTIAKGKDYVFTEYVKR